MAKNQNVLEINLDGFRLECLSAADAAAGLERQVRKTRSTLKDAFKIGGQQDYQQTAVRYGKELADQLLVLQLRMGQFRTAVVDAAMPLASVFVPVVNKALMGLTRFARDVAGVFGVLFGMRGIEGVTRGTKEAVRQQGRLRKAVTATGRAAQRSLAGFDEITRLNRSAGGSGGGGSGSGTALLPEYSVPPLSPGALKALEEIYSLLEPFRGMDFTPLRLSLEGLRQAFRGLWEEIFKNFSWVWFHILAPFGRWTIEEAAPRMIDLLTASLGLLRAVLEPVGEGLRRLLEMLRPVADFIGDTVLLVFDKWKERIWSLTEILREKSPQIVGIFENLGTAFMGVWEFLEPVLTRVREVFSQVFDGIWSVVCTALGGIIDVMNGFTAFLSQVFTGNFRGAWDTIKTTVQTVLDSIKAIVQTGFSAIGNVITSIFSGVGETLGSIFEGIKNVIKGAINGIISFVNWMVRGVTTGINAVIRALNKLSFTVPSWVPKIGGNTYGIQMGYVSAPQIPYLAKGAVLPANKPFMAMVGDQKHGTNIEAPLETIQQAVAAVTGSQTAALLAGFEATVEVQREILSAVLGIQIGDEVIGQAAVRYNRNMAIVRGDI